MRLLFILAGGTNFLPQERHRIQAQDIRALVGPVQNDVQHLDQHGGVAVVEIPLVFIEYRHHPLVYPFIEGEIAGSGLRKHLGHGLLEHVRHRSIVVNVVVVLVLFFPGERALRPLVLIGGMVQNHVECQQDIALAKVFGNRAQLLHGAGSGHDVAKIVDRITAIAGACGTLHDRQHMDQVHTQLLQIGQMSRQTFKVTRETVQIHRHPDPLLIQKPLMIAFALLVYLPELRTSRDILPHGDLNQALQLLFKILALTVEPAEQRVDGIEVGAQAGIKMAQIVLADIWLKIVKYGVQ